MNKTFKKAVTIVTATAAALAPWASSLISPAQAAGISAISPSGTNITAASAAVSTALGGASDLTVAFTTSTALTVDGQQISITLNGMDVVSGESLTVADLTLGAETLEAAPGTANNGAHEVTITNGASTNSNPVITIVLDSAAGPVAPNFTAGAKTLVVADGQLQSSASQGSYAITVFTSQDAGAGLWYVGNDNEVTVTANVAPTLSFNITTLLDDQVDLNTCNLETVSSTTTVNTNGVDDGAGECGYALAIGTNAENGFVAQVLGDDNLNTATSDLNDISDGTFSSGVEEYGFQQVLVAQSGRNTGTGAYNQPVLLSNTGINFTGLGTGTAVRVPNSAGDGDLAQDFIHYGNGINFTADGDVSDTTRVFHALTVGSGTPAGFYDQLVEYTVTATY